MVAARRHDRGLVVLALFKMAKAILLVLAGLGALSLLRPSTALEVREWLADITFRQGHLFVGHLLQMLNVATPREMTFVGLGSVCYGLLFALEGIGLWLERRWAEYLTIVATGSLVPFELYELLRRVTLLRALALSVNVVAVVYLVYRLRHPVVVRQQRSSASH